MVLALRRMVQVGAEVRGGVLLGGVRVMSRPRRVVDVLDKLVKGEEFALLGPLGRLTLRVVWRGLQPMLLLHAVIVLLLLHVVVVVKSLLHRRAMRLLRTRIHRASALPIVRLARRRHLGCTPQARRPRQSCHS